MTPRPLLVALLCLGGAASFAPREAHAQVDPDAGRARFQSGRALYDRGDFNGALTEFRASLLALPSPNTTLYIGRALRELGRLAEAWRALTDASDDARRRSVAEPRYARTAETAYADASAVAARLAFVTVSVPDAPAGTVVELNGRPLEPTAWNSPQPVDPPTLTLDARAPGRAPFHTANTVSAGLQAQLSVRFDATGSPVVLSPSAYAVGPSPYAGHVVASTSSPWRPFGVIAMGLGVAAGAAGILLGLHARNIESDLAQSCPNGCPYSFSLQSRIDEGYQASLLTNVSFGASAALIVGGALAYVLGRPSDASFAPDVAHIEPFVDPARGVAGVHATF